MSCTGVISFRKKIRSVIIWKNVEPHDNFRNTSEETNLVSSETKLVIHAILLKSQSQIIDFIYL